MTEHKWAAAAAESFSLPSVYPAFSGAESAGVVVKIQIHGVSPVIDKS